MSSKEVLLEDLKAMSEQLSSQVRTISVGVVVLVWGGLIGESATVMAIFSGSPKRMLVTGGLAFGALFVDFLQYVTGYLLSRSQLRKMECSGENDVKYNYKSPAYRLRGCFFWTKQILMALSVIALGWCAAVSLF